MDPVSALGVAAAALQFLDASIKAYNTFQEIRSSAALSTEQNKQLEDNLRSAKSLRASLASTLPPQGATDPVSRLTEKCASKADELLTLLEYVRGSGKKIKSARAFTRAVWKRKDIEKLHSSLKEDQHTLNQMVSQKLLPSIDLLSVQQSREFANINSIGQQLIKEQIEQRKIQVDHHAIVTDKLDGIQYDMQLRINDADQIKRREKLLESLWFPQIDQRRNEIKEPAPSTLGWLFGSESDSESDSDSDSDSDSNSNACQPRWPNFRQWLREDTSTYWISGKAGSGKSTLMAHILDDERTRKDLELWSSGQRLEVFLLYQLCHLAPAIADTVLSRLSSPVAMMPTWTERSLLSYITEAIQSSNGIRFCVFVDGLDEYTGSYDGLVDQIDKLRDFGNVKVCVSSRPELELVIRFRSLKQLRLQDLNSGDIKRFVNESLAKTQLSESIRTSLARDVVRRAEGVFMWASLVTQSLVKGSKVGDSKEIMQERLDSLPKDMNQLFERMLSDVDPVHRKSLAFYLQLMNLKTKYYSQHARARLTTIPIIATAQLTKRVSSYEEFAIECERTETQIATQSAGLLEI
ncbi:hypothetical protein F4823DRAFT_638066 [Ustulina deusta]|nr:hypothetical protein F4823DRAFT_638066 [Ustulina deusta]